jgi:hypothetical protein
MMNGFQNELSGIEVAQNTLNNRQRQVDDLTVRFGKMTVSPVFGFGEDTGSGFRTFHSSLLEASAFLLFKSLDRFAPYPFCFPLRRFKIAVSCIPGLNVVSPDDAATWTKVEVFAGGALLFFWFSCCRFHHQS